MDKNEFKIVLVGKAVSGKDTVGKYLVNEYGFSHISTGQLVRDYIAENDLGEPTRGLMQKVANNVRRTLGVDYFLKKALIDNANRQVIDGLRSNGEIKAARERGCIIIATIAPIEKRYNWAKERGRVSDKISFDNFVKQERAESVSRTAWGQNLDEIIHNADYVIKNTGDLSALYHSVDCLMNDIGIEKSYLKA